MPIAFTPAFPNPHTTRHNQSLIPTQKSPLLNPRPRRRRHNPEIRSAIADPNAILSKSELEEWAQISQILCAMNPDLSTPEADKMVGRAFGWGSQKFWRGDVKHETPSVQQAQLSLQFLREEIGLDDVAIAAVVKKFPEVIRLRLEDMVANVAKIQKDYPNLKGALLINSVKATPAVLGYDFDCEGDCKSECARCWVQF